MRAGLLPLSTRRNCHAHTVAKVWLFNRLVAKLPVLRIGHLQRDDGWQSRLLLQLITRTRAVRRQTRKRSRGRDSVRREFRLSSVDTKCGFRRRVRSRLLTGDHRRAHCDTRREYICDLDPMPLPHRRRLHRLHGWRSPRKCYLHENHQKTHHRRIDRRKRHDIAGWKLLWAGMSRV